MDSRYIAMRLFACVALAMLGLTGCGREISGIYLGKFSDGICWLQLVRTPDNRLNGQLNTVTLRSDGSINRDTVSVSGAVNGENVSLSARTLGIETLGLSGTVDGKMLTLIGSGTSPLVLLRSERKEYENETETLNVKARHIKATRECRQLIAEIDGTLARMSAFDAEVDGHLVKIPAGEESLRAITSKISEYVDRERRLAGNPNNGVARSQLSVDASQTALASNQLHISAQLLESSLSEALHSMTEETEAFRRRCVSIRSNDLAPADLRASETACAQASKAFERYKQKSEALSRSLFRFEQKYAEESRLQENLLRTADQLR